MLRTIAALGCATTCLPAVANPIVVDDLPIYKEGALVRIEVDAKYARVSGNFLYRLPRTFKSNPGSRDGFAFAEVPIYVPTSEAVRLELELKKTTQERNGETPNRWDALEELLAFRLVRKGGRVRPCWMARNYISDVYREVRHELPVVVALCRVGMITNSAALATRGQELNIQYRQLHVEAAGKRHVIYTPIFEDNGGPVRRLRSNTKTFRVDIESEPGISLRLVTANTVLHKTDRTLSIRPIDSEPIIVEVRNWMPPNSGLQSDAPRAARD